MSVRRTLYLPPHKNWSLFAAVSGVTADTDHEAAWLTDGRPAFPLRVASGTGTPILTNAAGLVNLVAVTHHLLDAGLPITIGGDTAGELVVPAYDAGGLPFHAWGLADVMGSDVADVVETLSLAIAGNSSDILMGCVFAGEAQVLDPSFILDDLEFGVGRFVNAHDNALAGIPPYSERAEARTLTGSVYATPAQLAAIIDWYRSEDAYSYVVPSLLIPDETDPTDARVVRFASKPTWREVQVAGPDPYYLVRLSFFEYPRTRW